MGNKFCTVATKSCGSLAWILLHVSFLVSRMLRWFLEFWNKNCAPLFITSSRFFFFKNLRIDITGSKFHKINMASERTSEMTATATPRYRSLKTITVKHIYSYELRVPFVELKNWAHVISTGLCVFQYRYINH